MASDKTKAQDIDLDEEYEGEQYINQEDIIEEIQVDGDAPMDDEEDDEVGEGFSHITDNSVQHFTSHTASVFAVSCHPTQPLAVSGGEDDLGYIWDITDGEVIVKLTGHTDSITCTACSVDEG